MPRAVGQRHPGVGDHPQVVDGQVVAGPLVLPGVGQDQRAAGGRDVLAHRVGQRGLPGGRPGFGQADLAGEHLPVALHQRHQRHRDAQHVGHQPRETVHVGVRGGGQAHLPHYRQPRRREQDVPAVTYRLRALADARHLTFHLPSLPDGIGCPRPALTCGDVDVILMGYRRTLGCEP